MMFVTIRAFGAGTFPMGMTKKHVPVTVGMHDLDPVFTSVLRTCLEGGTWFTLGQDRITETSVSGAPPLKTVALTLALSLVDNLRLRGGLRVRRVQPGRLLLPRQPVDGQPSRVRAGQHHHSAGSAPCAARI